MLFISYRRVDSAGWSGRIYDHLVRYFSAPQVFMDMDGAIIGGDRYGDTLRTKLETCRALIAVIGPQWLTCERDGRPRLEHEDDWVRREIVAALGRQVILIPLLVGGATMPRAESLPAEIRGLAELHASALHDDNWFDGLETLARLLRKKLALRARSNAVEDFAAALRLLAVLIHSSPDVALAVGQYREALVSSIQQLEALEVYKGLHDAFHQIENVGFRPLIATRSDRQMRDCRRTLDNAMTRIATYLDASSVVPAFLAQSIRSQLASARHAVEAAVNRQSDATVDTVLQELGALIGHLPNELDQRLSTAALALQEHARLDGLLANLRRLAQENVLAFGDDLDALFKGLSGMDEVRRELSRRVNEHTMLQAIDNKLRMLSSTTSSSLANARTWQFVKHMTADLRTPNASAPVREAFDDLASIEEQVDRAFSTPSQQDALAELHGVISSVFHYVDSELKAMSTQLLEIHKPLKDLLITGPT